MLAFELIVPAYNEAAGLEKLVDRTVRVAKARGFSSQEFKLVLVNNGSTDSTEKVLSQLAASEHALWLKPISVKENQGYGFGIASGLKETTASIVGWSHADLQCDPDDAFHAFDRVMKNSAGGKIFVKGRRHGRQFFERVVSTGFGLLAHMFLGLKCSEINAQPKVFHRDLVPHLLKGPKDFNFDLFALYEAQKNGWFFAEIDVEFPPRQHGKSHWASHWRSRFRTIIRSVKFIVVVMLKRGRL